MARAASGKGKRKPKAGERPVADRLMDAALALAASGRWRDLSMSDIAAAAGVPMADALAALPGRDRVLAALIHQVDEQVLASLAGDPPDGSAKDRLFDVLMRRFDALAGRRDAVATIVRDLTRDPLAAACMGLRLVKSMALMLEAAGLSSSGPLGAVRAKGLTAIYLNALRVWLTETDPDMPKTMATLDKGLRQAEKAVGRLSGGIGKKSSDSNP